MPNNSDIAAEVKVLREALLETQKQLASQQREIDALKALSARQDSTDSNAENVAHVLDAAIHSTVSTRPRSEIYRADGKMAELPKSQAEGEHKESPLSFKIGGAELTPGGFVDIENIYRTTNTQNNIATNFAAIPFSNTAQGHVTEDRTTAQYSRLSLKVTDKFGPYHVLGYFEADFSGNAAPNVYQTVNGQTNRLRLYFADVTRGRWEVLGGQTWSWLTPNRNGVSPMPADLALTYNEDQNLGVGIPYSRAAEFRVAFHPNEHWSMGVGIEDPNQFIGGFVALPTAFSATLSPQFDNGSQAGAPNLFPDILSKIAYDTKISDRHFHVEMGGLLTGARASVVPIGATSFSSHSAIGGGGEIAANYALMKNLVLLGNAYWTDGGARYLVATGPQLVVRPNAAGTDVSPSMVHASAGSAGLEWKATPKTVLAAYYGADYFGRNFFRDTTNLLHPNTIIGYGGPGSANTNNRTIQQPTFDLTQDIWRGQYHGALQFYTQYSYLTRAPWFVAPGAPKNAHLNMVYMGLRLVLSSGVILPVEK
ncbi:MAG TPA: hypothetical protein VM554_02900 [Acidisarcina sp.]|nr:hypothetical protein [Acidisarcina sp.]